LIAVFLVSALAMIPTVSATTRNFMAAISPTTAYTSSVVSYTITITNDDSSSHGVKLGSAKVTIPAGFTSVTISSVTASPHRDWTANIVSGQIKLNATGNGENLQRDEYVSVTFDATSPATADTYTWTTTAYESGTWTGTQFTLIGSQPTVVVSSPPNTPPVALDDSYSTDQDTTLDVAAPGVLVNDADDDGDPLTAVLVSDPSNGVLTLNDDGSFTYTPDAGYTGEDRFIYTANDGIDDSNVATVSITINEVPIPPPPQASHQRAR